MQDRGQYLSICRRKPRRSSVPPSEKISHDKEEKQVGALYIAASGCPYSKVIGKSGEVREVPAFCRISVTTIDPTDTRKNDRGGPLKVIVPVEEVVKQQAYKIEMRRRAANELMAFVKKNAVQKDVFDTPRWREVFQVITRLYQEEVESVSPPDIEMAAD